MTVLYLTADKVGGWSGGSQVTHHESEALKELVSGKALVWGRDNIIHADQETVEDEPWIWDERALRMVDFRRRANVRTELCHIYAGTFSRSVEALKAQGTKVAYTAAAHSIEESRKEHEAFGIDYAQSFPHLVDPALWDRYVAGYRAADVVICPSRHSAECMRAHGCANVDVIPHGHAGIVEVVTPPEKFTVGYLGAGGPDKGLIYLIQAWQYLNYPESEAVLVLAGNCCRDTLITTWVESLPNPNIVRRLGWLENVSVLYNNIVLYVQPSVTEGFGMEVLEAMAHGRPVLCSDGAGAADIVPAVDWVFPARSVIGLAQRIDAMKQLHKRGMPKAWCEMIRMETYPYSWDLIRERYKEVWKGLLNG